METINLTRRRFGTLLAGAAALGMTPRGARAQHRLDLGGYAGPELTAKPVKLRFLRQNFAENVNTWINDRFAEFTAAYPNIAIEQEMVPFGDLQQKMMLYIQAGRAPDIMMGRTDLAPFLAAGKLAVDLNEFLSREYLSLIQPAALESASFRGALPVMPWDGGGPMILFNKDLFRQAGVDLPPELAPDSIHEGWTVEQWLDTLRALKSGLGRLGNPALFAFEASTLGNGGPGSNYSGFEGHFIRMMGDPNAAPDSDDHRTWAAISEDGFTATGYFDSEGAKAGMRNYQTLFNEGLTPQGAVPQQFRAGTAAVAWQATSLINRYSGNPKEALPFEWGVTVLPKGKTLFGCNVAEAPFVYSGSSAIPEAVALLGYLCNSDNRLAYHKERGSVPVRDDLIEKMPLYREPKQQLSMACVRTYVGPPKTPGWIDYYSIANSTIKDIALGTDPQAALRRAAGQVDQRLAAYKRL